VVGPIVVVVFFALIAIAIGLAVLAVGYVEATWSAEVVANELAAGTQPTEGFSFGVLRDVTWTTTSIATSSANAPGASVLVVVHADLGGLVPTVAEAVTQPPGIMGQVP